MAYTCRPLERKHLKNPISVRHAAQDLSFEEAKELATELARQKVSEPMLLAWFDKKRGKFSPQVECCDTEKPSWLVYAESRGGNIVIDINDQDYVFVFCNLAT
ncbi:MAG: AF1514 family protein [Deltaproteobacteria bacterium]|nr:AF1514 family protein [Deltaproteobacteria bacterium]MBW1930322.1 AF1514 family protein [Deltaproteobacteria bacterium]MBW2025288.1 AF1514 family protein [Deltaproteobacteria bacterium]MBW2125273.1 AF1514 family protein [Deltaproteobacteria bacterium]